MGGCSSKIEGGTEMIKRINPNDINAAKTLLVDMWNIYDKLNSTNQKKLDILANKVSSLEKTPLSNK